MSAHTTSCARALFNVFVKSALNTIPRPQVSRQLKFVSLHGRRTVPPARPFSNTAPRAKIPRRAAPTAKVSQQAQLLTDDQIPAKKVRIVDDSGGLGPLITRYSALRDLATTDRLVCVSKPPRFVAPSAPEYEGLYNNWDEIVESYVKAKGVKERRITKLRADAVERRANHGNGVSGSGNGGGGGDALSGLYEDLDKQMVEEVVESEQDGEDGEGDTDESAADKALKAAARSPALLVEERGRGSFIRLPNGEDWVPVCKVENRAEAAAKAREEERRKKEARKLAPEGVKIIEINWAIDVRNDLDHRLKKLRQFLEARRRVEIVIAPKKGGKRATEAEARNLLKSVRAAITAVDGAKEAKPMEGNVGAVVRLLVEGKRG